MPDNPYYKSPHWRDLRAQCIRRDGGRCTVPGCIADGTVADHIETRPDVPYASPLDVLENLRTLCMPHDAQVKERRRGQARSRKQGGRFRLKGCDVDGWPLDPARRG